jgi:hypothetical protein
MTVEAIDRRVMELSADRRVRFGLDVAEHVHDALAPFPLIGQRVADALRLGRRWLDGEPVRARALYGHVPVLLGDEAALARDPRAKAALFAAISAMYYAAYEADRAERDAATAALLPNDILEIGREEVARAARHAREAAASPAREAEWQRAQVDALTDARR